MRCPDCNCVPHRTTKVDCFEEFIARIAEWNQFCLFLDQTDGRQVLRARRCPGYIDEDIPIEDMPPWRKAA